MCKSFSFLAYSLPKKIEIRTNCFIMRFLILFLFLPFIGFNQVTKESLTTFVNDPVFKYASISFDMVDLQTGKSVLSHDANRVLITASTAKLFSTASAIELLGPNFQPETRLYTEGTIDENGVLHGNIWIRGAGDPSLGSKYFGSGEPDAFLIDWVTKLQSLGIKQVAGAIIADASEFGYNGVPDGWSWNDIGNYYGAGPSGLTIYDNLLEYKFEVPVKVGATTKLLNVHPAIPGLHFKNNIVAAESKGDNAYIYGAPYAYDRFGEGSLPAGSKSFVVKGSLPDPELLFAQELERVLNEKGIATTEEAKSTRNIEVTKGDQFYANMHLLHSHKGVKLIDVAKETNFRSVNLFAEHMITLVGRNKGRIGTTNEGIRVIEEFWKSKIDLNGMRLADGSGLSRSNAISARHFTQLLNHMHTSTNSKAFFATLPITGVSGTMVGVCKDERAHGKIHAKSGSINGVRSYAGYIKSESGKIYSFALIVNNADCASSILKRKMEILFNSLVTL
jgi:serine-type D-Ala-D-Ala carboxypeptidase/endopeptidase (penicillin-binding protein 4)